MIFIPPLYRTGGIFSFKFHNLLVCSESATCLLVLLIAKATRGGWLSPLPKNPASLGIFGDPKLFSLPNACGASRQNLIKFKTFVVLMNDSMFIKYIKIFAMHINFKVLIVLINI